MKPLKLIMTGFGPYAQTQEIDFNQLNDRSFFLIHGPTGSGKTTILDAICFALYGDTSGMQRDGKSMRSSFARPDELTSVQFVFSIGQKQYRIYRHPTQEIQKKSGTGTTAKQADATLWEIGPEGREETKAAGHKQVNEKIVQLLGFKSEQFRQVVLLPQGDFRRLLLAGSGERQEIMEVLFKTEHYRKIEEKLKERAHEIKLSLKDTLSEIERILHSEAESDSVSELTLHHEAGLLALTALTNEVHALNQQVSLGQKALSDARLVEQKFIEKQAAQNLLAEIENNISLNEEKSHRLKRAKAAAALLDVEKHVRELNREVASLSTQKDELENSLNQAQNEEDLFTLALETELQREEERADLAGRLLKLKELEQKNSDLLGVRQTVEHCKQRLDLCAAEREALGNGYLTLKRNADNQAAETVRLQEIAALIPQYENELEKLRSINNKRTVLDELSKQHEKIHLQTENQRLHSLQCEKNYQTALALLTELQTAWIEGQAALMAEKLTPGVPCPVCGSVHHPTPAGAGHSLLPTGQAVESQELAVKKLDDQRQRLLKELNGLIVQKDVLENRINDLSNDLGESLHTLPERLVQNISDLEQALENSYQSKEAGELLLQELAQSKENLTKLELELKDKESEYHRLELDYRAAQAVVQEKEGDIPPQYRDLENLRLILRETAAQEKALSLALEKAKSNLETARQNLIKIQTSLSNTEESLSLRQATRDRERQDFFIRLEKLSFTSFEDYQSAKLGEGELLSLEKEVVDFNQKIKSAQDRFLRAEENVKGLILPHMAELEQAVLTLQQEHESKLKESAALKNHLERETLWLTRLDELGRRKDKLDENYAVIGQLADTASGNNDLRLSFQRFVLSTLLDDVAAAANERLKTMTRNRYLLQRKGEPGKRNTAGGLDLEVFDNYSGTERPANTLSGGETFLASLSLALGLVDVVQAHAGGMHLDTIFIDEGFGTLDSESLDFAINALIDLQQKGRLVGIISHVPELKERIDARLEVSPSGRGSEARFVIG